MAWALGELVLGSTSAVTRAEETHQGLTLDLAITSAEHVQLQEICAEAGHLDEVEAFLGGTRVVDASREGRITIYVEPDTTQHMPGWYVVEDFSADWSGSTTFCLAKLTLRRLASPTARGVSTTTAKFEEHDF